MGRSRNVPLQLAVGCLLPLAGCAHRLEVRLISGTPGRDAGCYTVNAVIENAVVENGVPLPLSLSAVSIEMTTYDERGGVVTRAYPFSFAGEVAPLSRARLPLHRPDREQRVHRSKLVLRDLHGRVLSELPVGEEADPSPPVPADVALPD
jgi:hypothetical protein